VKHLHSGSIPAVTFTPIPEISRDCRKEKPVPEIIFRPTPASTPTTAYHSMENWNPGPQFALLSQRITFNAAYGNERVIAFLFLPKNASPTISNGGVLPAFGSTRSPFF